MKEKTLRILIVLLLAGLIAEGIYLVSLTRRVEGAALPSDNFFTRMPAPWYYRKFMLNDEWPPMREMERLQADLNRIFDRSISALRREYLPAGTEFFEPRIDMKYVKDAYVIKVDIPGMDKDKIDISVDNHMLNISGERKKEIENKGERFFRRERSYGYFLKTIPLPADADEGNITAEYKKGVLVIKIGKTASGTPAGAKKIQII